MILRRNCRCDSYGDHSRAIWAGKIGALRRCGPIFFVGAAGVIAAFRRNYKLRLPWTTRSAGMANMVSLNTSLRLEFYGGQIIPTAIYHQNISDWYALYHPRIELRHEGRIVAETPMNWTIFVLFKSPAHFSQLLVSFSNPGFPPWEVKRDNQRFAIVHVSGEIPPGMLEIYGKPSDQLVVSKCGPENSEAKGS